LYFIKKEATMITNEQINTCTDIARRFGARRLVLFGGAAEDPARARDIDLLCDGVEGLDFFRMGAEMEERTQAVIDLVPMAPATRFTRYVLDRGKILHEAG
jgi:predicted nucleotidyltransferase